MNDHEWIISPAGVLDGRPQQFIQVTSCLPKNGILEFGANGPSFASFGQANNGRPEKTDAREPSLIGGGPGLSSTEWSRPRSPCCGSDPTVAVPCRSYTWRFHWAQFFPGVSVGGCCDSGVFVGASR